MMYNIKEPTDLLDVLYRVAKSNNGHRKEPIVVNLSDISYMDNSDKGMVDKIKKLAAKRKMSVEFTSEDNLYGK